jgi:hypothetical protein
MTFADHLFKRRHFDRLIMTLCVHWYVRYKLSYRDLMEMMAEWGLSMAHTTIMRWVIRFIPVFEQRWRKYAKPVGRSRRGSGALTFSYTMDGSHNLKLFTRYCSFQS